MVDYEALTSIIESIELVRENMLRAPQGGVFGGDAVIRVNEDYVRTFSYFEGVLEPLGSRAAGEGEAMVQSIARKDSIPLNFGDIAIASLYHTLKDVVETRIAVFSLG